MTANSSPISPDSTPRRAVTGELSHLMERTTESAATMYAACQTPPGYRHFAVSFLRNIFSMRSVIRNPLTMLIVDDTTAMQPSTLLNSRRSPAPAIRIAPTTRDRRDRVGQRHQRRVEQRRNPAHQLQAQRHRQHQNIQTLFNFVAHAFTSEQSLHLGVHHLAIRAPPAFRA